jgi:paraquat-inducible protein B
MRNTASLVTRNTRFWNTSGIDISAGADGFKMRTPSFQAMVSGGVSFGVTSATNPGEPVDGWHLSLFMGMRMPPAIPPSTRRCGCCCLFDQSVRGLSNRAPVEFRGITIGRVADISFDLVPDGRRPAHPGADRNRPLPDAPGHRTQDTPAGFGIPARSGRQWPARGAQTGSLITGALFVDLDYYPDSPPMALGKSGEFRPSPPSPRLRAAWRRKSPPFSTSPGLADRPDHGGNHGRRRGGENHHRRVARDPQGNRSHRRRRPRHPGRPGVPRTAADLRKTLAELRVSVASMGPDGAVQGDLLRTLDELRASLRSLKSMTTTIDEKPNSLIFGRESSGNPNPKPRVAAADFPNP